MKRRIFCAVMTVVLVLTMLPVVAAAEEAPTISFTHTVYEESGLVDVVVYLNNNPGFVTATIPVTWDNDVLNLYNVDLSTSIVTSGWCGMTIGTEEGQYQSNGTYYLAWDNDTSITSADDQFTADGELCMLQFSIVDAEAAETAVNTVSADIANLMSFDMEDNWSTGLCSELGITLSSEEEGGDEPVVEPDENSFQIISEAVKGKPGENVDVVISLKNNPGIASIKFKVTFDQTLLTLNSVVYNDAGLGGMSQQPQTMNSPVTLNWFNGSADTTGDMVYATLNFTIADTITDDTTINIEATFDPDDIYNIAGDAIDMTIDLVGVNVVIYTPGDITGDDKVNNRDLTALFQYLSDWDIEVNEKALDVNGDGKVNNRDLTLLFQYLSDWDVTIY